MGIQKAWLIVNEFLRSDKFAEIYNWLMKAAHKHRIDLILLTNAQILPFIGDPDWKRKEEKPLFVLFWDKDVRLAKALENRGLCVFNSSGAIGICDDKAQTHLCLEPYNIPMPKTILAPMTFPEIGYTNYEFLTKVEESFGYPLVVKECFGSFGQQVYLAEHREQLLVIIKKIGTKPMLFQQYIESSKGRDIRLQVVGDRVVTAMYRYSHTDFRANITNGGCMKYFTPNKEQISIALQCTKAIGLDFAGVDLLFGEQEEPIVCEVNSNAHFKNIYECTGINIADHILEWVLRKAGKAWAEI